MRRLRELLKKPWLLTLLSAIIMLNVNALRELRDIIPTRSKSIKKMLRELEQMGYLLFGDRGDIRLSEASDFVKNAIKSFLMRHNKTILSVEYEGKRSWIISWFRKKYVKTIVVSDDVVRKVIGSMREKTSVTLSQLAMDLNVPKEQLRATLEILKVQGIIKVLKKKDVRHYSLLKY